MHLRGGALCCSLRIPQRFEFGGGIRNRGFSQKRHKLRWSRPVTVTKPANLQNFQRIPGRIISYSLPATLGMSGRYQICVAVRNPICVKILHWKTQFIIPPNQIAVFHPELYEFILIQVGADFRMQRFLEEWLEIDFLALPIAKFQFDTISSQVICFDYFNIYHTFCNDF